MDNITIADMMIALGQMQKDIDRHKADSSMWFNRFLNEEKAKNELQKKIYELQKRADDLANKYGRVCEGTI